MRFPSKVKCTNLSKIPVRDAIPEKKKFPSAAQAASSPPFQSATQMRPLSRNTSSGESITVRRKNATCHSSHKARLTQTGCARKGTSCPKKGNLCHTRPIPESFSTLPRCLRPLLKDSRTLPPQTSRRPSAVAGRHVLRRSACPSARAPPAFFPLLYINLPPLLISFRKPTSESPLFFF